MTAPNPGGSRVTVAINRAALVISFLLLGAIVVLWWRDRERVRETPRWEDAHVVELRPSASGDRERWIVAVNPGCAHCAARLEHLAAVMSRRPDGPALGVLLVDVPLRPDPLAEPQGLAAGVWWDSAGTWRRRWGRDAYGEVLVFSPGGSLRRVLPPDSSVATP